MEIDLTKGPEHAAKIKFMVILLAIVFIIVISLIIFIGVREPEIEPTTPKIKQEISKEKEKIVEEPEGEPEKKLGEDTTETTELTESDIEQIKIEIVTGERDDVPEGLDATRSDIIKEYISKCRIMENTEQILECLEIYYLNNDESFRQGKEACENLGENEKTTCLDQFYYKMAREKRDIFCEAIKDTTLKQECKNTII